MVEPSEQIKKIAGLFDAISDSYDSVGVDFFQPIARGLVQALTPVLGESWLDIGCGRGAVSEQISLSLGDNGRVLGFDISEKMIDNARKMAERKNLSNFEFIVDNAQSPQKITEEFDVISSCLVLFFLPDPLSALQNWRHYLKNSGRIGVTTFGENDRRWREIDHLFNDYLPPQMLDARTSGVKGPFASDDGMESLFLQAGYREVKTMNNVLPVKFESMNHWYNFSWSTGQREMWLRVPEAERPAVRAKAESYLQNYVEVDGSIIFTQGIRHTLALK
jgi:ubiquinone/menaquinone biosynthesis C-methylase UbiE